jgi:Membrane-fusion protein
MGSNKMKTSTKIKTFVILFIVAITVTITARHFIGLHFKKKFSVRPAPGVIVKEVEKSQFYKSIETFGTAIAQNSKTYRIKKDDIIGNLRIENRFVKKGEIIAALKNSNNIIADFAGKLGKRELPKGS